MSAPQSVQMALIDLRRQMLAQGVEDPMPALRKLSAHVLGIAPGRLTLHMPDPMSQDAFARLADLAMQHAQGAPVARLLGFQEFWGRSFEISKDVLDPRADTETVIETCLAFGPCDRVLDLGTGSGCIGVTLAAEWHKAQVMLCDISAQALEVARANARRHEVDARIETLVSDWFSAVTQTGFDLIVSNPPYIAKDEMETLSQEVRGFDPVLALTDEADGLSAYRQIIQGAPAHLRSGGWLCFEIGWQQGDAVTALMQDAGFDQIDLRRDMAERDRVVLGRWSR